MRKLAPAFIVSSLMAFAAGNVFAATSTDTSTTASDKMGAPTVSNNTKDSQRLSYGDKSNTATGTNAKAGAKSSVMWNGVSTDCTKIMAMDDSRYNAKMKADYATARTECDASASSSLPSATSPGGTAASSVNSSSGTSGK